MKVLEAGDRSSQVGYVHSEGLAWIDCFQEWRMRRENALLLSEVCVINAQRKGWIERQIVLWDYSLSTCLGAHREPHKTILPVRLERKTGRIRGAGKKGGWGRRRWRVRKGRYEKIRRQ